MTFHLLSHKFVAVANKAAFVFVIVIVVVVVVVVVYLIIVVSVNHVFSLVCLN